MLAIFRYAFIFIFLMSGCKTSSQPTPGGFEQKPNSQFPDGNPNDILRNPKPTFESKFALRILSNKNNEAKELCKGTATATLLTNRQLVFPDAPVKCLSVESIIINLSTFFNAPEPDAMIPTDGKYVGISYGSAPPKKPNSSDPHDLATSVTYTPPAPFILGPLVQNSAQFAGFNQGLNIVARTSSGLVSNGAISLEVKDVGRKVTLPNSGYVFDDVIYYVRRAVGFDELPLHLKSAPPMPSVPEMHYWFNTRPVAYTKMVIYTKTDTLAEGIAATLAKFVVGDFVTIELTLQEHREL